MEEPQLTDREIIIAMQEQMLVLAEASRGLAKQLKNVLKIEKAILDDYAEQIATLTMQSQPDVIYRVIRQSGLSEEESQMFVVK